ncbi:hypothetical protein RCL1_003922 [Eukaryota sp. TZLM3-RCL]
MSRVPDGTPLTENLLISTRAISVDGIETAFPYPNPYPTQLEFMKTVFHALTNSDNALLESPTGTGKSACLLASTLSFTRHYALHNPSADKIRVIYASRTHTQLNQLVSEIQALPLLDKPRVSILAGRERYCLNDYVRKQPGHAQGALCNKSLRACQYAREQFGKREWNAEEIEDFIPFCSRNSICPYLYSRDLAATADIVLMPYNYLLSSTSRRTIGFPLTNSIIILDEGHNIAEAASMQVSIDISSIMLASAISELEGVVSGSNTEMLLNKSDNAFAGTSAEASAINKQRDFLINLLHLKKFCINLSEFIDKEAQLVNQSQSNSSNQNFDSPPFNDSPGSYILKILHDTGITTSGQAMALETCIQTLLQQHLSQSLARSSKGCICLSRIQDLLSTVFSARNNFSSVHDLFRVVISRGKTLSNAAMQQDDAVLSFWCFSGSVVMRGLQDTPERRPRSILLASGTLSPLPALKAELGIPFNAEFLGSHIISPERILVLIVEKGPSGVELNASFKKRQNAKNIDDLGACILNYTQLNPDGTLVFFPSYAHLEYCWNQWKETLEKSLSAIADVYFERSKKNHEPNKQREELERGEEDEESKPPPESITGYLKSISELKRSVLFGVCRGKASEGLDFKDRNGRLVIVPGIPFPQLNDPRVMLKKKYLDSSKPSTEVERLERQNLILTNNLPNISNLTGNEWYTQSAMRAVNQAIGRVIRHQNDYGVVVLSDVRFSGMVELLPKWMKSRVKICKSFAESMRQLRSFFDGFKNERINLIEKEREKVVETSKEAVKVHFEAVGSPKLKTREEKISQNNSHDEHVSQLLIKFGHSEANTPTDPSFLPPAQSLSKYSDSISGYLVPTTPVSQGPRYRTTGLRQSVVHSSEPPMKQSRVEENVVEVKENPVDKVVLFQQIQSSLSEEGFHEFKSILTKFLHGQIAMSELVVLLMHCISDPELVSGVGSCLPENKRKAFKDELERLLSSDIEWLIDSARLILTRDQLFLFTSSLRQIHLKDFCIANFAELLINVFTGKHLHADKILEIINKIATLVPKKNQQVFLNTIKPKYSQIISDSSCSICHKQRASPFVHSLCSHVACQRCWHPLKHCPFCHEVLKKGDLRQYFS